MTRDVSLKREDAKWWLAQRLAELEQGVRDDLGGIGHGSISLTTLVEYARALAARMDWIDLADIFAGEMGLADDADDEDDHS